MSDSGFILLEDVVMCKLREGKLRINPSFCQVSSSYLQEVEIAIARDKISQHSKSKKECATKDHTHGLCKLKFSLTVYFCLLCAPLGGMSLIFKSLVIAPITPVLLLNPSP